jgi:hypothetical protein
MERQSSHSDFAYQSGDGYFFSPRALASEQRRIDDFTLDQTSPLSLMEKLDITEDQNK